jgi:hypothetical protein
MSTSSWRNVIAWAEVQAPARQDGLWVDELRHSRTVCLDDAATADERLGYTLWESRWDGRPVGIAWRWVSRGQRLIALEDPMQISSNLRLVWSDGQPLSGDGSVLELNNGVHGLPWQDFVRAEVWRPAQRHRSRVASAAAGDRRDM